MSKQRKFIVTTVFVALLVLGATVSCHLEDTDGFNAARRNPADLYLESPLGATRYRIYGNPDRPTVVLLHGFNGYLESWSPNIAALVNEGYRVVAYDLWGRGLSSRPRVDLTLAVFDDQLATLLEHLGTTRAVLMGSSFGCVIAADYALKHPESVDKLVLVGPAGWPSDHDTQWIKLPVLGDLVFHLAGRQLLRPKVEAYFRRDPVPWAMDAWDRYAAYPGFTRAALSTLRFSPVTDYTDGWRRLGTLDKPILFIWGKQDVSFPYANTDKVATLIPHAKVIGLDEAAHWVNIEQADAFNAAVSAFLHRGRY
jgi:pimeloyl-ACP methyl ester carboxylesterase